MVTLKFLNLKDNHK